MNQSEKILSALDKAGERGVLNINLNKIAFRYSARLGELRQEGYTISTIFVKKGVFKYVLHQEKQS